ncbi:BURP domain-containing protein 10-like [Panicum miliaceum]|uniref:BURP domain-containing protein 10-like n=1 Tax=Panicum miliaceum TaxID=4540 RepID=A0A3L6RZU0_PANMI|nr:BURP domain-containing protein 10-like [Panicum miliaceum]
MGVLLFFVPLLLCHVLPPTPTFSSSCLLSHIVGESSMELVVVASGGQCAALVTGAKRTTVLYYASKSELNAYWQSVCPNRPIPSTILAHFSAPSGNQRKDQEKEHYWSIYSDQLTKRDAKIFHNWAHRIASEKLLYPESDFTTGSKINLYIDRAAASHNAFLRRDVADSIPMSTENFTDIATMASPVSVSMVRDMWSTLSSCEHPREVVGEQKACATSVESMHKFAASALGTSGGGLHAFSTSLDVLEEGIGSPSHIYKVAVVRAVTAHGANKEASNTVTCHSMSFPFALFYCHAVNPTRIYEVTLHKDEDDVVPAMPRMPMVVQALAVCHVNTSGFDPTLNYWMKLGLKPAEASVCHFLTRGDVLWTPDSVA